MSGAALNDRRPVAVDFADLVTPEQRAGMAAAIFLPILIAIGAVTIGGVMPANAVLFSLVGNLAATLAALSLAMLLFDRERLLYG